MERKRISLLLFITTFSAYGLIFSGFDNWNSVSRFGLTLAIAERGEPYIDKFAAFTGDKAILGSHFISEKAPGLSFLALPVVSSAIKFFSYNNRETHWFQRKFDTEYLSSDFKWIQWLGTLTTSSLFTALAVSALFRIALLLGTSTQGALFCALLYGFATPTWAWATTFFSHSTCGAFLVFGLWAIVVGTTSTTPPPKINAAAWGFIAGMFLTGAIVIEYSSAPAAIFIGVYGLWRAIHFTPSRATIGTLSAVVGAFIAGIPLMAYNDVLFGSPFSLGYSYSVWTGMKTGLWGVGLPSPLVAAKLLIGGERGLLWLSPVLALTPFALWSAWKSGEQSLVVLCFAIFLSFWIINSGFVYWRGGSATGPRYITPALAFLALPFAWFWDSGGIWWRRVLIALAVLSAVLCFAMAAIEPYATDYPEYVGRNAVVEILLPKLANDLTDTNFVPVQVGFNPYLTLGLYLIGLCGGVIWLWRLAQSDKGPAAWSGR
jgi:hypothetical protein